MSKITLAVILASMFFWACDDASSSGLCGNARIDDGETCDPPESCPATCDDGDPCTLDSMSGSAAECNLTCANEVITACAGDDGCCPSACNANTDSDCQPACGNGAVEQGETCDPPASCPAGCDDGNACTVDSATGAAEDCDLACAHTVLVDCQDGDGCCPAGCDAGTDSDCSVTCGNEAIEPGETCDPPATCPLSCDDENDCTLDVMTGSADNCNAACSHTAIVACVDDDLCCPAGCSANTDNDCSVTCGNEAIEPGETCDPPDTCPQSCDDSDDCTLDFMTGSADNCNVACSHTEIVDCADGDLCCPAGCHAGVDSDCEPVCGNDVIEPGETCDPPDTCPTDCDDADPCTDDTLTGDASDCDATCPHDPISDCVDGDGCCPAGCEGSDSDCGPPSEICTGGDDEDGDGFVDCLDLDCFGEPSCTGACSGAPIPIGCGDGLAGDTSAEANALSWYSCLEWDETGGELVFEFTAAEASEVSVTLAPDAGVDVDVFVLEADCRQDACTHYGDEQVTFIAAPGNTYFLVVDSFEARAGAFGIDVACVSIAEDCNNGVDDDFDTEIDCDDGDCAGDPACPGSGRCSARFSVHCNDARFSTTTNDNQQPSDVIDVYSCVGWDESGPEVAWAFTAPRDGQVSVGIEYEAAERDLDLFVLEDQCAGDRCLHFADESLTFAAVSGTTYYFVIDGRDGDFGDYTLRIYCQEVCDNIIDDDGDGFADCADTDCHADPACALEEGRACITGVDEDADGRTDCDDPACVGGAFCPASGECYTSNVIIACGGELSGNTTAWSSTDVVNVYSCTGDVLAGPESAGLYSAAGGGQAVAIILDDSTGGQLEVLVLEDACDGAACLACGDDSATFDVQDGHDYYIVVDAPEGVVGSYSLRLDCLFEDCFDAADNDGDGQIDCDDPDCQGSFWCPAGVCQQDGSIGCDETQTVSVTGEPNEVMYYPSCMGDIPSPGGENVRLFTTESPVQVGVIMMPQGPGTGWLMALEGECSGETCLMMGGAGIMFHAVPGKDYFIVIDGEGDFQLQTTCSPIDADICVNGEDDDLDGSEDCADPDCQGSQACPADGRCVPRPQWWSLGCDQEVSGATSQWGATDVIDSYDCAGWDASGPEVVYSFVPETTGAATIELSHPAGIDLDVYILQGDCAPDACIAAGQDSVTFGAYRDRTYLVVVDGADGDAGAFSLTAGCAP
ncbi:MAG: hypothetical protein JXR96_04375 [Deltaproteobacteria bacterium]|nr:hypothetical protein [Deltaproteobacteria bacterium]